MTNPLESVYPYQFSIPQTLDGMSIGLQVGLTKREYIAIQLLNGFLSSGRKDTVINNAIIKAPEAAVILADELIVQLNKTT